MKRTNSRSAAFLASALLPLFAPAAFSEVTIAQVDPSPLLTSQRVDIYLSPADGAGRVVSGLDPESFALYEGIAENDLSYVPDFELQEGVNAAEGISFHLLVDNSGSMYETMEGGTRMDAVRRAVRSFLNSVDNPRDAVGLASFNTGYVEGTSPTPVRSAVEDAFSRVSKPTREEAYTELYAALEETAAALESRKGRKVVILLSDGENYPYAKNSGKPHPKYGTRTVSSADAVAALVGRGVSVFPVHFGPARRDASLRRIAAGTGGMVFDAGSERELAEVYREIRARVLREYRLSYRPAMLAGDRRFVKVEYRGDGSSATQYYFTGTIFGSDSGPLSPLLLIPLLLAPALWFALTRLRLLNRRPDASLEVLDGGATKVFSLSEGRTVIAAGGGGLTIAAAGSAEAPAYGDATIVRDERSGAYAIAGSRTVYVNNKPTTGRTLAAGDVIRIGDATIVFDEPASAPSPKAAAEKRKPRSSKGGVKPPRKRPDNR